MIGDVVLYYSRFIILFTQIIHKIKQKIKHFLSYGMKNTVVQYNSWHIGAGTE